MVALSCTVLTTETERVSHSQCTIPYGGTDRREVEYIYHNSKACLRVLYYAEYEMPVELVSLTLKKYSDADDTN